MLFIALLAAGVFLCFHRDRLSWKKFSHTESSPASDLVATSAEPAHMSWQRIDRANDGFSLEMPAVPSESQAAAQSENGGIEPVRMLVATPAPETTFALTWDDNPPVVRVNRNAIEATLNMARDGMLARTHTVLDGESPILVSGYRGRAISAHNANGGVLQAQLILAGDRLYGLMALFPSSSARREEDVRRFFNSFNPSHGSTSTNP